MARKALVDGIVGFDEQAGYRGPITKIDVSADWGVSSPMYMPSTTFRPGASRWCSTSAIRPHESGFSPTASLAVPWCAIAKLATLRSTEEMGKQAADKFKPVTRASQVLNPGDVVYVEPSAQDPSRIPPASSAGNLRRHGRDRSLDRPCAGDRRGLSFDQIEFDRATQAMRQPGPSFKPIVYSAALDNGYTPSTVVVDAPLEIDQGPGMPVWHPENYEGHFYGPRTLRFGIEMSRNVMTVRLAQDVGMPLSVSMRAGLASTTACRTIWRIRVGRRRDDGDAHGHRLLDVRQRRTAHSAYSYRPHPGSLRARPSTA